MEPISQSSPRRRALVRWTFNPHNHHMRSLDFDRSAPVESNPISERDVPLPAPGGATAG
jgi:hypothetical protein